MGITRVTTPRPSDAVESNMGEVSVRRNNGAQPSSSTNREPQAHPSVAIVDEPEDNACAICFEEPAAYGLLSECRHVFCWKCIDGWRAGDQENAKHCPVCRVFSAYHVLSDRIIAEDGAAGRRLKQELFATSRAGAVAVQTAQMSSHLDAHLRRSETLRTARTQTLDPSFAVPAASGTSTQTAGRGTTTQTSIAIPRYTGAILGSSTQSMHSGEQIPDAARQGIVGFFLGGIRRWLG